MPLGYSLLIASDEPSSLPTNIGLPQLIASSNVFGIPSKLNTKIYPKNIEQPITPRDIRTTCKTLMTKNRMGSKDILDRLQRSQSRKLTLQETFRGMQLQERIGMFLATLELVRLRQITIIQDEYFDSII